MNNTWLVLVLAFAQSDNPAVHTLDPKLQQETHCLNPDFWVYSPGDRSETPPPLVIYLHGAGGVGDDLKKVRGQSKRIWKGITSFSKGPALVVAPQCLEKAGDGKRGVWEPADLNILLKHLKATLRFDHKRIYLAGNSMGGYGSWAWGARNPEHFAAIAPVVGGIGPGGPKDVTPDLESWAANLATHFPHIPTSISLNFLRPHVKGPDYSVMPEQPST